MSDINLEGMAIADGVVETIVSIAVQEVEGVAAIGGAPRGGIRSVFASKHPTQGIEVLANNDDTLSVSISVGVYGGYVLPDVATAIRTAVVDAVRTQIGLTVATVDVYIDTIQFGN